MLIAQAYRWEMAVAHASACLSDAEFSRKLVVSGGGRRKNPPVRAEPVEHYLPSQSS